MPSYIYGPGDAAGGRIIESLRLINFDVSQEASRRKITILLGDGAFYNVKITVDAPDVDDLSLTDIFLRAAGIEDLDDRYKRAIRQSTRRDTPLVGGGWG